MPVIDIFPIFVCLKPSDLLKENTDSHYIHFQVGLKVEPYTHTPAHTHLHITNRLTDQPTDRQTYRLTHTNINPHIHT